MTSGVTWLSVDLEHRLRGMGLSALCDLTGDLAEPRLRELAGEPVTRARTRRLYRLPDEGGPALFVKIQVVHARDLPARRWLSYLTRGSPLVREAKASQVLAGLGIRTPDLLAFGAEGRLPGSLRAMIVTREVAGHTDLRSALAGGLGREPAIASIAAVETAVTRLHGRGFALNGAAYRDCLIPTDGCADAEEVVFVDAGGFGRGWRRRRRDLRALAADRRRYGVD